MAPQMPPLLLAVLILVGGAQTTTLSATDSGVLNRLIASYSSVPDPFHWGSFFSLPRTEASARQDGWSPVNTSPSRALSAAGVAGLVSTWCRGRDYRVCLLFDAAGVVAGMQVSVSVEDFEKSFGSERYPIALESQWRRHAVLDTEVYSATALFVSPSVLSEGGRVDFQDADDTVADGLLLENGNSYWAMPTNPEAAAGVAFTRQGCVGGMGRHFSYNMSPGMACEEHRPFFLLFDDVTGAPLGFGVTLFGKASRDWFGRWWLEAPRSSVVKEMFPEAPQCLIDWSREKGLVTLHVYFRDSPWKVKCSKH